MSWDTAPRCVVYGTRAVLCTHMVGTGAAVQFNNGLQAMLLNTKEPGYCGFFACVRPDFGHYVLYIPHTAPYTTNHWINPPARQTYPAVGIDVAGGWHQDSSYACAFPNEVVYSSVHGIQVSAGGHSYTSDSDGTRFCIAPPAQGYQNPFNVYAMASSETGQTTWVRWKPQPRACPDCIPVNNNLVRLIWYQWPQDVADVYRDDDDTAHNNVGAVGVDAAGHLFPLDLAAGPGGYAYYGWVSAQNMTFQVTLADYPGP